MRRLLRIAHLDIDLGELRLAVGAQVFVAEAAHDLEILFEAADHQELLEDLRRLRQRVERAGLYAAGHQVIARAFRRGARHERRLDFEEAQVGELLAHGERDLGAQDDVALHLRPAQVHVAVLQARVFGHVDVLFHGERRGLGFVENPDLRGHHLHLAGGHVRVDGFLASGAPPCPPRRSRIRRALLRRACGPRGPRPRGRWPACGRCGRAYR